MIVNKKTSGVALVSVLLLLAVLVTLMSFMIENQYLSTRQAGLIQDDELIFWQNTHAESWAIEMLTKQDFGDYNADMLTEQWSSSSFDSNESFKQSATIVDLQSRFNLNNLLAGQAQQAVWVQYFKLLLKTLDIEEFIAHKIIDWIDKDENPIPANGAEDQDYLSQVPSRRAANQPLSSIEELLMIDGIDLEIYQKLSSHVSALPVSDLKVNVNTAGLELLQSIIPNGLTTGLPVQFVSERDSGGFLTMTDLLGSTYFAGTAPNLGDFIDIKSDYFELESSITINDVTKKFLTGIKREVVGNDVSFSTIYRKRVL